MKKVIIGVSIFLFTISIELTAQSEQNDFTAIDRYADNTPAGFTSNVNTLTQYLVKSAGTEKKRW